jgi:sec-independent protein translocase protein TatA
MPGWVSPWHIAIVLVIVLLVFGPRRLPELGASIGKAITGFKHGLKEDEQQKTLAESSAVEPPAAAPTVPGAVTPPPATGPPADEQKD